MNRRELLASAGVAAGAVAGAGLALNQVLAPVKALAADAKPIRIKAIETFNIEMPATQTEIDAGVMNRTAVTRVVTESGVKGYLRSAAWAAAGEAARRPGAEQRPRVRGSNLPPPGWKWRRPRWARRWLWSRPPGFRKCRKRWWAPICSRWNSICKEA